VHVKSNPCLSGVPRVITFVVQSSFRLRVLLAALLLGCQPSIGDHCIQSTDCSATGDRQCDTSQLNGYCVILNCLPNKCPSGSACIATNAEPLGCLYDDRHAPSRFSRQDCLKTCTEDSDCRVAEGYACIAPKQYGILVLDNDQTEKVCLAATSYTVSDATPDVIAPVCSNSGPNVPEYDAAPGYQGDAGVDAQADAQTDAGTDAADASDAATDALGE
jgi:hypothetical protein